MTNINFLLTSILQSNEKVTKIVKKNISPAFISYPILSMNSLKKCVKNSLENLHLDIDLKTCTRSSAVIVLFS